MSGWRRCDRCRKVRSTEEFDGEATTCTVCLTAPVPAVRKRAAPVTKSSAPPRSPKGPAEPAARRPLLGSVGSGDLEVRERRARRAAYEALTQSHPEEFALLLRDARAAEGLRPLSTGTSGSVAQVDGTVGDETLTAGAGAALPHSTGVDGSPSGER